MHRRFNALALLVAELKECSISRSLQRGKSLHDAAVQTGDDSRVFIANTLIHMYGKCGSLLEASNVFQGMRHRTVVSWTALILGYAENGEEQDSLLLLSRMEREGCLPNARTFSAALKACTNLAIQQGNYGSMGRGRALHLLANCHGETDVYVESTLVDMYAKCGSMKDARKVFDGMEHPDMVSWTALILGYADNGEGELALDAFSRMDCPPSARTFVAALKACAGNGKIRDKGSVLHLLAACSGQMDVFVESTLVDLYAKSGKMEDARIIFDGMKHPVLVTWNAYILGYVDNGQSESALEVFSRMGREECEPDEVTFIAAFKACANLADMRKECDKIERGKAAHLLSSSKGCDSDMLVGNTLVDMYAKCRSLHFSHKVFNTLQNPSLVSWTALMLGYAENGEGEAALDLFSRMKTQGCAPDHVAFVAALKACSDVGVKDDVRLQDRGCAVHLLASCSGKTDIYVETALVDMYAKCGNMENARKVFDSLKHPDVALWNALMLGYADSGNGVIALDLFSRMRHGGHTPDGISFLAAVRACSFLEEENAMLARIEVGSILHLLALRCGCLSDTYVGNALIDMYSKLGCMGTARKLFESMEHPDVVSWNSLLLGYAENGEGDSVLEHFLCMRREGCEPDALTLLAALKACCMLGALAFGKTIHAEIARRGLENDVVLANYLVDLYAKCGSLSDAEDIGSRCPKDLATCTSLMAAYSRHGDFQAVFRQFDKMQGVGLQPDGVALLCVLTACSHAGLVTKGEEYFEAMSTKYGVECDLEHYTCMLDMLGRANKLDETMALLRSMPLSADGVTWMAILGACRKWKNVELGKLAFESLMCLDDRNSGAYTLMSNIK